MTHLWLKKKQRKAAETQPPPEEEEATPVATRTDGLVVSVGRPSPSSGCDLGSLCRMACFGRIGIVLDEDEVVFFFLNKVQPQQRVQTV